MLNKATDTAPYHAAQDQDRRAQGRSALPVHVLGHARRRHDGAPSSPRSSACRRDGKPISIIDVSGVPSDIVSVVVAVLSRLVFDFAIWSRSEAQRPVLLVCEEAHRYIPSDKTSTGQAVAQDPRADRQGRPQIRRLARPDHAAPVRSCRRRALAMRHDHRDAPQQRPRPGVREGGDARRRARLPRLIPALRNRECIVCGEGVSIPIRVAFDDLERDRCPASSDPLFSELWRQTRRGGSDGRPRRQALARAGALEQLVIPAKAGISLPSVDRQGQRDRGFAG